MDRMTAWLRSIEAALDAKGTVAWIGALVLSFVLAWPLGLALLGYMIWSGRMNFGRMTRCGRRSRAAHGTGSDTGNSAFEHYREETLKRLEEEENAFSGFLDKLRKARERAEFDQFMSERDRSNRGSGSDSVEPA